MSGVSNVATAFRKLGGSTDVRRTMMLLYNVATAFRKLLQSNERALQALEAAALEQSIHLKLRSPTPFTSNLGK